MRDVQYLQIANEPPHPLSLLATLGIHYRYKPQSNRYKTQKTDTLKGIRTMEDLVFATLLFVVYFCFACCIFHNPDKAMPKKPIPVAPGQLELFQDVEPQQNLEDNFFAETLEANSPEGGTTALDGISFSCSEEAGAVEKQEQEEGVPVLQNQAETVTSTSPVSNPQPSLYAQALDAIDNLGKREARKVMGGLKLQQKRNGVELSTELMVASIKREFKASPERVIAVIQERLPEWLPAVTDPIELAS